METAIKINSLRKEFGLQGTPIRMIVREKGENEW